MIRIKPSIKIGSLAPDFSLKDAQGEIRSLADFKGSWLLIFFYPADFTPGCISESCAFRDYYSKFKKAGVEVVGVSGDSDVTHRAFAAEYKLPYAMLSDPDATMRRAYTVPHILGRLSGRTTFVIDPKGVIRYVFNSRSQFLQHVHNSLEFVNGN